MPLIGLAVIQIQYGRGGFFDTPDAAALIGDKRNGRVLYQHIAVWIIGKGSAGLEHAPLSDVSAVCPSVTAEKDRNKSLLVLHKTDSGKKTQHKQEKAETLL